MARVFERPRYTNQARNKLVSIGVATKDLDASNRIGVSLGLDQVSRMAANLDYTRTAKLILEVETYEEDLPNWDSPLEQYLIDVEIGKQSRNPALLKPASAQRIAYDYLATRDHHKPHTVLCDEKALFFLVHAAIEDRTFAMESPESRLARHAASDLLTYQLVGQKVAPGAWLKAASRLTRNQGETLARMQMWHRFAESLQYRAHPMWVKYCRLWAIQLVRMREQTRRMVEKVEKSTPHERHLFRAGDDLDGAPTCYNYAGVLVIYYNGYQLVLDNSAADYFRVCMLSLVNMSIAMPIYRLTGDPNPANLVGPYAQCLRWIGASLGNVDRAREVARHMHLAYVRWQNRVGEDGAPVDCGWALRDEPLKEDMVKWYPNTTTWYDMVMAFNIPERARAELFKLYHLIPPPDIDALELHEEIIEKTGKANECNLGEIQAFIRFCSAYDVARVVSKTKSVCSLREDPGYSYYDTPHGKKCLNGKFSMAPEEEWGKFALHKHFPYDHSGDFHIFGAKDATRVVADLSKYMDRSQSRSLSQFDTNELLSAVFNGPRLSNGEMMAEWRERVFKGEVTAADDIIAAEAGKAENTKPGKKVRETLSGCDIAREFLTEIDHCLRPLAAITPGVSIRVDVVRHKRKFQTMANCLSQVTKQTAFGTSTDISGWSPRMPRKMFHAWQDYALSTTACPNPTAVRVIWEKLTLFVDRRGIKKSGPLIDGNVQGWPATSDTTMHAHILALWAHRLRKDNILSAKEAAYTLCLIDDAATVVAVDGSYEEAAAKAVRARDLLTKMYLDLGFEMDQVKSYFSSIKFVYLNELYVDGAQVAHGTKTLMRIDRDHARRFASVVDACAAVQGVAASAASQGADPFLAYWMAGWHAYQFAFRVCPEIKELDPASRALFALTPGGMNGLGLRPICAVMATGAIDQMTWFAEICLQVHRTLESDDIARKISAIWSQASTRTSALSVLRAPHAYVVDSHRSAQNAVRTAFRDAARETGMAEPFKSLDLVEQSKEFQEAVASVLRAGAYEAALLEEVSGNMPDAFVDEVMARVDKSEIIAVLLGSRGIGSLRRRVAGADKANLRTLVDLLRLPSDRKEVDLLDKEEAFAYVKKKRDDALEAGGFTVLNHTYPCPFSLWAFAGIVDLDQERAVRMTTLSYSHKRMRKTIGSSNRNLYDSVSTAPGAAYKGYRSASVSIDHEARVALYNPVKKKVAAGLAALRWARDSGAHYQGLFDLFTQSWCGNSDIRLLEMKGKQVEVSAKRLSARHMRVNHLVHCFPNTQSAVRVDARAISRAQAAVHHMHDMMTAITTLRCAGLLEAALHTAYGDAEFSYGFTFKPKAAAIMCVPDAPESRVAGEIMEAVPAFTSIKSDLSKVAAAVCSYETMAEVLRMYEAAGERAATNMFDSFVDREELMAETLEGTSSEIRRVRVIERATTLPELMRGRFFASTTPAPTHSAEEFIRGEEVKMPKLDVEAHAALDEDDSLRYAAKTYISNKCIDLANRHAVQCQKLLEYDHKDALLDAIEGEFWEEHGSKFLSLRTDSKTIIRLTKAALHNKSLAEGLAVTIRWIGVPGFRMAAEDSEDEDDTVHTVMSFLGRVSSVEGQLKAIAIGLRTFKASTSNEYASFSVAGTALPAATATRVLKGQWLMAAARYEGRANQKVAQGNTDVAWENARVIYLRSAPAGVRATGNVSMSALYSSFIDRTVQTVANGIDNMDVRDEYLATIGDNEFDVAEDIETDEELIQRIKEVSHIGGGYHSSVDGEVLAEAAQDVLEWVRKDTGTAKKSARLKARKTQMTIREPEEEKVEEPKVEEAPVAKAFFDFEEEVAQLGGDVDDSLEMRLMMSGPHAFMQWVMDVPEATAHAQKRLQEPNLRAAYAKLTASKAEWDAFVEYMSKGVDTTTFTGEEDSIFDEVYFDDDDEGGDWMA